METSGLSFPKSSLKTKYTLKFAILKNELVPEFLSLLPCIGVSEIPDWKANREKQGKRVLLSS